MAELLEILKDDHPVLRQVAEPCTQDELPKLLELAANMLHTMEAAEGIGLAAPQVGVSKRLVVIHVGGNAPLILINPELELMGNQIASMEGCLSLPGKGVHILRNSSVRVKFWDDQWVDRNWVLAGMESIVVQHEIDHLNGILMTDHKDINQMVVEMLDAGKMGEAHRFIKQITQR